MFTAGAMTETGSDDMQPHIEAVDIEAQRLPRLRAAPQRVRGERAWGVAAGGRGGGGSVRPCPSQRGPAGNRAR